MHEYAPTSTAERDTPVRSGHGAPTGSLIGSKSGQHHTDNHRDGLHGIREPASPVPYQPLIGPDTSDDGGALERHQLAGALPPALPTMSERTPMGRRWILLSSRSPPTAPSAALVGSYIGSFSGSSPGSATWQAPVALAVRPGGFVGVVVFVLLGGAGRRYSSPNLTERGAVDLRRVHWVEADLLHVECLEPVLRGGP